MKIEKEFSISGKLKDYDSTTYDLEHYLNRFLEFKTKKDNQSIIFSHWSGIFNKSNNEAFKINRGVLNVMENNNQVFVRLKTANYIFEIIAYIALFAIPFFTYFTYTHETSFPWWFIPCWMIGVEVVTYFLFKKSLNKQTVEIENEVIEILKKNMDSQL